MSIPEKVHIIGIGDDGLRGITTTARELLDLAELILGTEKTLSLLPVGEAERFQVGSDLSVVPEQIEANSQRRIVVLATGDPLFYGVARFLCDRLGKDRFEVIPHVSTMQLAFARVKESWEEAYLADLANQGLDRVLEKVRTAEKAGLFMTKDCQPADLARGLLSRHIDYFSAYICENLGSPDERVTHAELGELVEQQFSPLNVMVLLRNPDVPDRPVEMVGRRLFGNPDEEFLQSQPKRGLLTPFDVRCIALAAMDLGPTSVVWDVGAGSGSVAIEAAQIASGGKVYAIEMDPQDHELITANADRFGIYNLTPVLGEAPEAWTGLPEPDSIFVGGTGRGVTRIVELAYDELKNLGRLVANVGSIENLAEVHEVLRDRGDVNVRMINIAVGTHQLERIRFESMNPTFLVTVIKGE